MTIHTFPDTGLAYDACQCDDTIKDGDILLIEREGVVGIADTWPIAITEKHGVLHTTCRRDPSIYLGDHKIDANLVAARELANEKGFALRH